MTISSFTHVEAAHDTVVLLSMEALAADQALLAHLLCDASISGFLHFAASELLSLTELLDVGLIHLLNHLESFSSNVLASEFLGDDVSSTASQLTAGIHYTVEPDHVSVVCAPTINTWSCITRLPCEQFYHARLLGIEYVFLS